MRSERRSPEKTLKGSSGGTSAGDFEMKCITVKNYVMGSIVALYWSWMLVVVTRQSVVAQSSDNPRAKVAAGPLSTGCE